MTKGGSTEVAKSLSRVRNFRDMSSSTKVIDGCKIRVIKEVVDIPGLRRCVEKLLVGDNAEFMHVRSFELLVSSITFDQCKAILALRIL